MPRIEVITRIQAPVQMCFDLSRDIDFHQQSLKHTGEQAVAGTTTGLIGLDQSVTWRAKHFGLNLRLTSKITAFDPPHYFQDTMTKGAFKSFVHDHHFETTEGITIMRDVINFASPLFPCGRVIDHAFMADYLKRLIIRRAQAIRGEAERRATD